jgi:hypothetical protein
MTEFEKAESFTRMKRWGVDWSISLLPFKLLKSVISMSHLNFLFSPFPLNRLQSSFFFLHHSKNKTKQSTNLCLSRSPITRIISLFRVINGLCLSPSHVFIIKSFLFKSQKYFSWFGQETV